MPIEVQWSDEARRILRWDISGAWTIDELYAASHLSKTMRDAYPNSKRFYVLLVAHDDSRVPTGALAHVSRTVRLNSDERSQYIRVGGNYLQRTMDKIFVQAFQAFAGRISYVDTLEEAYALIQEQDADQTG